jgi:hypothetical protein
MSVGVPRASTQTAWNAPERVRRHLALSLSGYDLVVIGTGPTLAEVYKVVALDGLNKL